jgi:hypothetical protein
MPDLSRLTRTAAWLYWTALALTWVLPLTVALAVWRGAADPLAIPGLPPGTSPTAFQGALAGAVSLLAVLPIVAACRALARLFDRFRRGDILGEPQAEAILRAGRALLLAAAATVLVPTLRLLVATWNGPALTLSLGLDGGTLGFAFAAGVLAVIGWAMREAARVQAENAGFV